MPSEAVLYQLFQFQAVLATGVGVGLAFPILIDLFAKIDDRLVMATKHRMETMKNQGDRDEYLKLAELLTSFNFLRRRATERMLKAAFVSIISATFSLSLLLLSAVISELQFEVWFAAIILAIAVTPVLLGIWHSAVWASHIRPIRRGLAL